MQFNVVDTAGFRKTLSGSFYTCCRQPLGATAWSLLEQAIGKLG